MKDQDIIDLSIPSNDKSPKNKRYTELDRHRVIELYRAGKNKSEVSQLSGIPLRTVRVWLNQAMTAGLLNQVSSNENSNASSLESDLGGTTSDMSGAALLGSTTEEANLPGAMEPSSDKTTENSVSEKLILQKFFEYVATNANVEMSTADSTSEKRKRECGESLEDGAKRRKSTATESLSSFDSPQSTASLHAMSYASSSSSHQQQPIVYQGGANHNTIASTSFYQQSPPLTSSMLFGRLQNVLPFLDSNRYYQQKQGLIRYYQQQQIVQYELMAQQQQLRNQHQQQRQRQQKQQQQHKRQQQQQHQQYQNQQQQQQPGVSYHSHQLQHEAAISCSAETSQAAPMILANALTSPKTSGRDKKGTPLAIMEDPKARQEFINAYQKHLNQLVKQNIVLQNCFQKQKTNESTPLQMAPVVPLQIQTSPVQNSALPLQNPALSLQNPALSLENPVPPQGKSGNNTASPLPSARSPLPRSYSPLAGEHSPLSRAQSPLILTHTPLPSSTPNPIWQQYEHQRQNEEREPALDFAYQSQDSQSRSVPPSQEKLSSPDQAENVDGFTGDDIHRLTETTMLRAATSIMNPLNIKGKKRRKKKVTDEVVVCDNEIPNAATSDDLHDFLIKENERIGEEFVDKLN